MSDVLDVLPEILSRLPTKSLLRFRAVSKPICALIDSPYFINLHMNQSMKKPKVFTFVEGEFLPEDSYYFLFLDSHPTAEKLQPPFDDITIFNILGSCNGLICLSNGGYNPEILLWNPSTRKYKFVPSMNKLVPSDPEYMFTICSLGYDHVNDDNKIVRLSQYGGSNSDSFYSKIFVYSLKLNVWESVELDFPYHICRGHGTSSADPMSDDMAISGAIHWTVTQSPATKILICAFDLATKAFQLLPQPEYPNTYEVIDLGILGGCLCVVGSHGLHCVDIWVMEKYGVKESWKKVIALTKNDVAMNLLPSIRPLMYIKNGKKVLLELDNGMFIRYDLKKNTSKHVRIRNTPFFYTLVYHDSLF